MHTRRRSTPPFWTLALLLLTALMLGGCKPQLIARFDQQTLEQTLALSANVDRFYTQLLHQPAEQRTYERSRTQYLDIELEINGLIRRQQLRSNNELSLKQTGNVLALWQDERANHQKKNGISDFLLKRHRTQMLDALQAIAQGEQLKPQ